MAVKNFLRDKNPVSEQARVAYIADNLLSGNLTFSMLREQLSDLDSDPGLKKIWGKGSLKKAFGVYDPDDDVDALQAGRKAIEDRVRELALSKGVQLGEVGDLTIHDPKHFWQLGGAGRTPEAPSGLVALHEAYNAAQSRKVAGRKKRTWSPQVLNRSTGLKVNPNSIQESIASLNKAWLR